MNMWELFFILILIAILVFVIFSYYKSYDYRKSLTTETLTRGMNGTGGQTLQLKCPNNQNISIYKANYICTSGGVTEDPNCDAFVSKEGQVVNFFNPLNTYDVSNEISQKCNGKNNCTWDIPAGSNINMCGQTSGNLLDGTTCTGQLQLIGTYDCVPK